MFLHQSPVASNSANSKLAKCEQDSGAGGENGFLIRTFVHSCWLEFGLVGDRCTIDVNLFSL